ncbi:MAG TPA: single-stranded-DNA-specific exonuclease RecJ [Syntrophorhabdales bacterium]|nr:single-stranded-DNA-specific exonuclease RecJ [Syntrophorhabdales bacterium]
MLKIAQCDEALVKAIEADLGLPPLIARILVARGMRSAEAIQTFLSPKLEALSDPFLLPDIERGITRTVEAIEAGRRIGLFGDYDADGITSVALMKNFLQQVGIVPDVCLPTRQEGYGLNQRAVKTFSEHGVELLICLDCGSSNSAEVEATRELGMETIVIDHHEVGATPAHPHALINPKREGSRFPTRDLAACGVTFFFLLALRRALSARGLLRATINLKKEMDLVAVGTVADMVPLTGDNRLLVRFGLETMRQKPRAWFKSFLKKRVVRRGAVDELALGFGIAPRINAAGRVSDPQIALAFLTTDLESEAEELLSKLNEANKKRQDTEEVILRDAMEQIETEGLGRDNSVVLFREDWPIGVLGIVAQRLVERYGKPAVVITRTERTWRGSARGLEGMDLHQTIASLSALLLAFGGHKHACGITLVGENLLPLREAFEREVTERLEGFIREIYVDAVIEFGDLTKDVVEMIDLLRPFGIGNPRPSLLLPASAISVFNGFARITDDKNRTWHGSMQKRTPLPAGPVARIVATPTIREEMGEKFVHLLIKEFLPAE